MDDLPAEIQDRESSTFDFVTVKQLLIAGYYTGPAENDDSSRGGMRAFALRGDPSTHRKSILRKAVEADLLEETPSGYATTSHGVDILDRIAICEECGGEQLAYSTGVRTGKHSGFHLVFLECPSCNDPTHGRNVEEFVKPDGEMEEAINVMESYDVVCYLNGKNVAQAKSDLGLP